jgi:hypothetical protein
LIDLCDQESACVLKKVGERERERATSDSAKVCGFTGVCSVAKSTAARRSEQHSHSPIKVGRDYFSFSVQAKKIISKTN